MAVSRKAMTEGIRTFLFPGTPCERNLTIPQSAALTAPFTQGSLWVLPLVSKGESFPPGFYEKRRKNGRPMAAPTGSFDGFHA